jgi:hypothetical protein
MKTLLITTVEIPDDTMEDLDGKIITLETRLAPITATSIDFNGDFVPVMAAVELVPNPNAPKENSAEPSLLILGVQLLAVPKFSTELAYHTLKTLLGSYAINPDLVNETKAISEALSVLETRVEELSSDKIVARKPIIQKLH